MRQKKLVLDFWNDLVGVGMATGQFMLASGGFACAWHRWKHDRLRPRSPSAGWRARCQQPGLPAVPGSCKEKQLCSLRARDTQSSSSLLERTALCRSLLPAALASPGCRRSGPSRRQPGSPAPGALPPASRGGPARCWSHRSVPPNKDRSSRPRPSREPPALPPDLPRPARSPPLSARPRRPGSGSRPAGSAPRPAPSNRPGRRVAKDGLQAAWGPAGPGCSRRASEAARFHAAAGPAPGCGRLWVPTPRWVPTARPGSAPLAAEHPGPLHLRVNVLAPYISVSILITAINSMAFQFLFIHEVLICSLEVLWQQQLRRAVLTLLLLGIF